MNSNRTTDWNFSTCTKECEPDAHSEACIKATVRILQCPYCCDGDDCMICGRKYKQQ